MEETKIYTINISASDDDKEYSRLFERTAGLIFSLMKCTENDLILEGFMKSKNRHHYYFVNCDDNYDKFGINQYFVNVDTGNIYTKKMDV